MCVLLCQKVQTADYRLSPKTPIAKALECCWVGCPRRFKPRQWTCLRSFSLLNRKHWEWGVRLELKSATRTMRASSHCPWPCCLSKKINEKNVLPLALSKLDCREGNCKHRAYPRPQLLLRKISRVVNFIISETKSLLSAGKEFTWLPGWHWCYSLWRHKGTVSNKAVGSACAP